MCLFFRSFWLQSWTGSAAITLPFTSLPLKKKTKQSKNEGKRRNNTNKCKTEQMIFDNSIACVSIYMYSFGCCFCRSSSLFQSRALFSNCHLAFGSNISIVLCVPYNLCSISIHFISFHFIWVHVWIAHTIYLVNLYVVSYQCSRIDSSFGRINAQMDFKIVSEFGIECWQHDLLWFHLFTLVAVVPFAFYTMSPSSSSFLFFFFCTIFFPFNRYWCALLQHVHVLVVQFVLYHHQISTTRTYNYVRWAIRYMFLI